MTRALRKSEDVWVAPVVVLAIFAAACFDSTDGDLGFHLATGREVLRSGRIPATNVLSFTVPQQPWLLHQWLPGVLFELAWQAGSIRAVILLKAALSASTWALAYASARLWGARPVAAGLACLLTGAAASFRFEARPLLFSDLGLAALWLSLGCYVRALGAGQAGRGALTACAALLAVSCQLHAGAVFVLGLLLIASVGCVLEPYRARALGAAPRVPVGGGPARALLATALLGALLGAALLQLYHPHGARVLWVPITMGTDGYLAQHLVEFRPPHRFAFEPLAAFWLLLGVAVATLVLRARRLHAAEIGLLIVFATFALRHVRLVLSFAVVAAPILAAAWSRAESAAAPALEAPPRTRRLLVALVLAGALATPLWTYRQAAPGFGFAPVTWPLAHFGALGELNLRGPVYASDAWAGPMLGYFYPSRRSFFDNRIEAYPRSFVREVYQSIRYAEPGWDAKLDRYGVELVLLRYTSGGERAFQGGRDNLRQRLVDDPRWALLFFDDVGALFARRDGQNEAQVRDWAIDGVDPDRLRFVRPPRAAAEALMRALARGPRSTRMLAMAGVSLWDRGQRDAARMLLSEARTRSPGEPWLEGLERRLTR